MRFAVRYDDGMIYGRLTLRLTSDATLKRSEV